MVYESVMTGLEFFADFIKQRSIVFECSKPQTVKITPRCIFVRPFGVATTEDGKQYSVSGTAAKILLEAISSGKLALPARIKMKVVQGKGPYQYTVPVVVE